jgi:hypothetical protein
VRAPTSLFLGTLALCAACDLAGGSQPSGSQPSPEHRGGALPNRPTLSAAPPATAAPLPSANAPLSSAAAALPASSAPASDPPVPSASLKTPKLLAKVEEGGCGLAGLDAKYLYARAPSCKEVLRIDRATGTLESRKLPTPMLVQAVVDGVAYGCPLGERNGCVLTRAPLEGGPATKVATLPGLVDSSNSTYGASMAGSFAQLDASGQPDHQAERYTLETVVLETGARAVVAGAVGIGRACLGPKGLLFDGALTPKENVGSPSWGLWLFATDGAPPRRLSSSGDISSVSSDEKHAYHIGMERILRRTPLDGSPEEQLTAEIPEPPSEPNRLRLSPDVRVASDTLYVSTGSTKGCWIYQVPKP